MIAFCRATCGINMHGFCTFVIDPVRQTHSMHGGRPSHEESNCTIDNWYLLAFDQLFCCCTTVNVALHTRLHFALVPRSTRKN